MNLSGIVEKIDEREGEELRSMYNFYPDKSEIIIKNSNISIEDVSGEFLGKEGLSVEKIRKHDKASCQNDVKKKW